MLAAGAALAAGRLIGLDGSSARFYAVVTLLPYLLVPMWVVLVVSVLSRRRATTVVALLLVVLHVAWVLPAFRRDGRAIAAGDADLVLVAVNAQRGNADLARFTDTLVALDADVIVITELTPEIAGAVDLALPPATYRGRAVLPEDGFFGAGIYTRAPLDDRSLTLVDGRPTPLVRFDHGARTVSLAAVHTIQPLADHAGLLRGLDDLAELRADEDGVLVLAGDFNATYQHGPFRDFLARTGARDAHQVVGRGLARTWPAGFRVPPFALLDHVVVGDGVEVVAVREEDAPGSDHRAVVARLRV